MTAPSGEFTFASPAWLVLIVPILLLLWLRRGHGADSAVIFPNLSHLSQLGATPKKIIHGLASTLTFVALTLACIALARPVLRNQYQSKSASGIDIILAFDVSLSMSIQDFYIQGHPTQRIDAAKAVVDAFIERRPNDRIGLTAFAGRPRNQTPITLDHARLRKSLANLRLNDLYNQGTVKDQGTAIGSAIAASATRLNARDSKSKIIILITDGANNSGKISPIEAAQLAKTLNIKIYTIAIGTPDARVDPSIMRFPYQEFDLPTLQEISSLTNAEHFYAKDLQTLSQTFTSIDSLEKTTSKGLTTIEDSEYFFIPLSLALLSALVAACLFALTPPPAI